MTSRRVYASIGFALLLFVQRPAGAQCRYFLGFTAATGANVENNDLLGWSVAGTPINYPTFASTAGLNLVGNAAQVGAVLRLTPNTTGQDGGAWFTTQLDVLGGFDTTFRFQITGGSNPPADGFAFVVQNSPAGIAALGGAGGSIGYEGIPNSLAVEFDTFLNAPNNDPGVPHVSVQTRGELPNSANHNFSLGSISYPTMADGAVHSVRIVYTPFTLNVFLDGAVTPNLSVTTDLGALVHGCSNRAPTMSSTVWLLTAALVGLIGMWRLSWRRVR